MDLSLRSLIALACLPLATVACFGDGVVIAAPVAQFTEVTAGVAHACGLTPDGVVACWSTANPRPEIVSERVAFSTSSTTSGHTCGLDREGRAFCWGFNTLGQLGTLADTELCTRVATSVGSACSTTPIAVETELEFSILDVGSLHTCALDRAGFAHCWGDNSAGQLGAAAAFVCLANDVFAGFPCSPDPLPVGGGLSFVSLSVGASHNCALTATGQAYCWGAGGQGRLGNGLAENSLLPTEVAGGVTFRSISAGGNHTCGVTTSGEVYCWGDNSELQLGSIATDRMQRCGWLPYRCVFTPSRVITDLRFTTVAAAVGGHTCGLTDDGAAYCWGLNEYGELLLPNRLRSAEPVLIDVGSKFQQISGGQYNTCGVTAESSIVCWPYGSPLASWVVPAK